MREGAKRKSATYFRGEADRFLSGEHCEKGEEFHWYRNDYHHSRKLTLGMSDVEVRVSRVSDVPSDMSEDGFNSKTMKCYERTKRQTQDLFRNLYVGRGLKIVS